MISRNRCSWLTTGPIAGGLRSRPGAVVDGWDAASRMAASNSFGEAAADLRRRGSIRPRSR
nr:hypothetical protein [Jatrophihabitans sp. GAS493]